MGSRWTTAAFGLAILVLLPTLSTAAQEPASAPPNPAPAPPHPAPAPSVQPAVTDPMLAPPSTAPKLIKSWQEALQLVRTHGPRYLASAQRVQQAEARSRVALAGMLPMVSAEGSFTHQFFTEEANFGGRVVELPPQDVLGVGARLRVPVFNLRALRAVGTGKRGERAAELDFAEERRGLALGVVDTMLATLATARVAELNRQGLQAALERLVLVRTRKEFGRGTALDVDRAEQDVAAARAELIQGDESLHSAREALGMALGSQTPIAVADDVDLEALEREVAQTCKLAQDLEARPDIAAARMRVEVAQRLVDDAELQYVPSVDLISELRHASQVMAGPNTTWNVQGVLTVPLYDGGGRYAAAREQRAVAEQARQMLAETRLAAVVAVARATRAVSVLEQTRDVARQQRDLARSIDERIRQGYAGGLGTSLDLVISAQSLRQAESRLVLLELQVSKARAGAVLARAECMY